VWVAAVKKMNEHWARENNLVKDSGPNSRGGGGSAENDEEVSELAEE